MAMPLILFPNIIVLSFSNLLIPEFSEFHARSEITRIKKITKRILKYTLIFSTITSLILLLFSEKLSYLMYKNTSISPYIKFLAPLVPFMYLDNVIDAILKGLDKQISVLKINILDLITSITLIFILIPKLGTTGYLLIIYTSELLNFTLSYHCLKKTINI